LLTLSEDSIPNVRLFAVKSLGICLEYTEKQEIKVNLVIDLLKNFRNKYYQQLKNLKKIKIMMFIMKLIIFWEIKK